MCVGLGIGQGFQPVAAFNYQAKKYKRVKKGLLFTMSVGFCLIGLFSVFGYVFASPIVYAFQESEAVNEIGTAALRYATIGVMFLPLSVSVNMLYQSIRNVRLSSFLSLFRSGLAFMPILLLGNYFLGLKGIQIAQPLADVITGLISIPFILHFIYKTPDEE